MSHLGAVAPCSPRHDWPLRKPVRHTRTLSVSRQLAHSALRLAMKLPRSLLLALVGCGALLLVVSQFAGFSSHTAHGGDLSAFSDDALSFGHCSCSPASQQSCPGAASSAPLSSGSPASQYQSGLQLVFVRGLAASLKELSSPSPLPASATAATTAAASAQASPSPASSRKRVLLVSYRLEGLTASDGIGSTMTAMARLLAEQHTVSVLFVCEDGMRLVGAIHLHDVLRAGIG